MYLKEIQLSGFKSFADKTNINLDNNITCIVGPNGSGKSNIVDAVRWVLGEQSVKNLRGNQGMADVIFSGSKNRSSLNLASVSLIFDNSDSYLKAPYSEISVTRKVFKTGENEYYLNNEKCRLKDISEMFIDSGVGKSSFNIISQGEIASIISDSSQDRRVIFESVAGVLKYKKRKEESLKKLDKTNNNLSRIKDIITELETNIEPLKEQSIKAKKYLDSKNHLESIEIALLAHDIDKLNTEYKKEKEEIESIQDKIISSSTNSSNDDILVSSKKEELNNFQNSLNELNQKLLFLTKEEERLNGEKNIIQERSKYAVEDQKMYENISNLKENKYRYENDLDSIKKEIAVLDAEKIKITAKIESRNNELSLLNEEKNKILLNINNNKQLENSISYKIKSLTDYIEQGGNINPNVKRIINNPKLTGIHNTIINLIDIDNEYTLALEVALGGAKDYVVVDNPNIAKICINYLKDNNLGRVTFFPLDVIKPRGIEDDILKQLKNDSGFISVLANLVKYDSMYSDVIKNQLGNVILVDTIDSANRIAKIIYNRYKIITLTGEVINVGGSITGGVIKTSRSIVSDKYELEKLYNEADELNKKSKSLDDEYKNLDMEISKLIEVIKNIELELIKANESINIKESNKSLVNDKYGSILRELKGLDNIANNTLSTEEDNIVKEYYDVINNKNDVLKQINLINKNKDALGDEIEHLEANYRTLNTKMRELESKSKELEISISKKDVKIDNMLNILSDTYSLTFERAKADYILEIDEKDARKEVNTHRSILKELGTVNLGAIDEYDRVEKRYNFLTKQREDLNKAIKMLLDIIDNLDKVMNQEFVKTFKEINKEFNIVFQDLFKGGTASLKLDDPNNVLDSGVEIIVSPPGKKLTTMSLLSGGEKSLTAISLLFAILNVRKVPFCLFDEVEAALDEANVDMFGKYLSKYKGLTQFLIITHKKKTMEFADSLYGITMQESGVSKLVSVKLID
ncbi:MAG TPA: AAA family ATPase [Bacilli bacterium]|nr:AAA family ATPase [Bacilli bacterium]